MLLYLLLIVSLVVICNARRQATACPNACSGQGYCHVSDSYSKNECVCFPGYHGVDCSIKLCPAAIAWVDYPYATDSAHADYAECSNMGHCNRNTGVCNCRLGFSGPACGQSKFSMYFKDCLWLLSLFTIFSDLPHCSRNFSHISSSDSL